MGGFRSFFIESKSFQLVIEEGGNFFSLKIRSLNGENTTCNLCLWARVQLLGQCVIWNTP